MKGFRAGVALIALLAAGCGSLPTHVPVMPPFGGIYTGVKAPLSWNAQSTPTGALRTGSASTFFLHEPLLNTTWAWGDATIEEAARKAKITRVAYADYEVLQVLGIFGQFTVHVHGD